MSSIRMFTNAVVVDLADRLRGPVIRPGDPAYDAARSVWNGMIDKLPAVVAQPVDAQDVATAIRFARRHDLLVSVRGGGHNVAGLATNDDGLVIDLARLNTVSVNPTGRTVRAGGGATIADLDAASQRFGLATPMGVVSETGIGGLTLGGGYGWLRRKHGLAIDSFSSAELVTAEGEVLEVSDDIAPDLMWGLRGGGGNFGVVTRFDFRSYPLGPEVMFAGVMYPFEQAAGILADWRDFMADAPEEISSQAVLWSVPASPDFPPAIHGRPVVVIVALYSGDPDEGELALRPLRHLDSPLLDSSGRMPYVDVQQLHDPSFPAREFHYYWKALQLDGLGVRAIDRLLHHASERPSPLTLIPIWHNGGAMSRVPAAATAFGDRSAPFMVSFDAIWQDPGDTDRNVQWARQAWRDMQPFSRGGVYVNFPGLGEEGEHLSRAAYGRNYERLARLKAHYDPTNFFRLNTNVEPA